MKWILATNNAHKIQEVTAILEKALPGVSLITGNFPPPKVAETSTTFGGNAFLKAAAWRRAAIKAGLDFDAVIADDSGLQVKTLGNAPGVRSARFAGPGANDADNRRKLAEALRETGPSEASFHCILTLFFRTGQCRWFSGICKGQVISRESGNGGFGYDPMFFPDNFSQTFAELPAATKNQISHRGLAWEKLLGFIRETR